MKKSFAIIAIIAMTCLSGCDNSSEEELQKLKDANRRLTAERNSLAWQKATLESKFWDEVGHKEFDCGRGEHQTERLRGSGPT
jgi:hypothetical protein